MKKTAAGVHLLPKLSRTWWPRTCKYSLSVLTFILLFYNIKEPDLICMLQGRFMKKTAAGEYLLPR